MTFAPTFKGGVEIGQKHYNLSIVIITTGGPTVQFRLLLLFLFQLPIDAPTFKTTLITHAKSHISI